MSEEIATVQHLGENNIKLERDNRILRAAIDKAIQYLQDEDTTESRRVESILYRALSEAKGIK